MPGDETQPLRAGHRASGERKKSIQIRVGKTEIEKQAYLTIIIPFARTIPFAKMRSESVAGSKRNAVSHPHLHPALLLFPSLTSFLQEARRVTHR
jgi:hypothetical protein